jgi:hypothetical protein
LPANGEAAHTILWRSLAWPGHEAARAYRQGADWHLAGTAVFMHQAEPCRLGYHIVCDSAWHTQRGSVSGWVGARSIEVEVSVDHAGQWRLNDTACPQVAGCTDLDLNFSPSTNLLPIRRLNLAVGASAPVRAAWLRFPSFELEPLEQTYTRLSATAYRYESAGGSFVAELQVNEVGLVTQYAGLWQAE